MCEGPIQGLEHTLSTEKVYSMNFTKHNKKFCLILHYYLSYLFVNGKEITEFKAKYSEIVATPLCLANISNNWSLDNLKKKLDLMSMSMILVLIISQFLILRAYHTFINT